MSSSTSSTPRKILRKPNKSKLQKSSNNVTIKINSTLIENDISTNKEVNKEVKEQPTKQLVEQIIVGQDKEQDDQDQLPKQKTRQIDIAEVITKYFEEAAIMREQFNVLRGRYNELKTLFTDFNSSLLGFEKLSNTTIKKLQKGKRQRKIGTNVTPSGFNKKKQISEELATFLNVANDTKMARTDVTKLLSAYIREKQLQNPDNRKFIIPDEKLTSLLRIKPDIPDLTYFTLQRHLKHLFLDVNDITINNQ